MRMLLQQPDIQAIWAASTYIWSVRQYDVNLLSATLKGLAPLDDRVKIWTSNMNLSVIADKWRQENSPHPVKFQLLW